MNYICKSQWFIDLTKKSTKNVNHKDVSWILISGKNEDLRDSLRKFMNRFDHSKRTFMKDKIVYISIYEYIDDKRLLQFLDYKVADFDREDASSITIFVTNNRLFEEFGGKNRAFISNEIKGAIYKWHLFQNKVYKYTFIDHIAEFVKEKMYNKWYNVTIREKLSDNGGLKLVFKTTHEHVIEQIENVAKNIKITVMPIYSRHIEPCKKLQNTPNVNGYINKITRPYFTMYEYIIISYEAENEHNDFISKLYEIIIK